MASQELSNRKMSQVTYDLLTSRKAELEIEIRQRGSEGGGHQRASLHDDAAAENALNLLRAELIQIGDLGHVDIIEPRIITETAGLGNQIEVLFDGEKEGEKYLILSSEDALHRKKTIGQNILPDTSPLGVAVLGKKPGEEVKFVAGGKNSISAKILKIDKGTF